MRKSSEALRAGAKRDARTSAWQRREKSAASFFAAFDYAAAAAIPARCFSFMLTPLLIFAAFRARQHAIAIAADFRPSISFIDAIFFRYAISLIFRRRCRR